MTFTKLLTAGALLLASASTVLAQDTSQPAPATEQPNAPVSAPTPVMPGALQAEGVPQAGFEIRVGKTGRLKVNCGEMALAECITAADPLLGRM